MARLSLTQSDCRYLLKLVMESKSPDWEIIGKLGKFLKKEKESPEIPGADLQKIITLSQDEERYINGDMSPEEVEVYEKNNGIRSLFDI